VREIPTMMNEQMQALKQRRADVEAMAPVWLQQVAALTPALDQQFPAGTELRRAHLALLQMGLGGLQTRIGECDFQEGVRALVRHRLADGWTRDEVVDLVKEWAAEIAGLPETDLFTPDELRALESHRAAIRDLTREEAGATR
jgi:hypothetical protein